MSEENKQNQSESTSKKEGFFSKLGKKIKKSVDDAAKYLDEKQQQWTLAKAFDDSGIKFIDLENGETITGHWISPNNKAMFRKNNLSFDHKYYANGKIFQFAETENKEQTVYSQDDTEGELTCFVLSAEIVIHPIDDTESAFATLQSLIEKEDDNILNLNGSKRDRAKKLYPDFKKAILAHDQTYSFIDEFVTLAAQLDTDAALIAAALVYQAV